jgi:cytochrome bd-type quinol oxidase subunit 1
MNKRNYIFILLLISILGFSFSLYTKYIKSYVPGIEKVEKSIDNEINSIQLNLSENIAFLEKMEKTKDSVGLKKIKGDKNKEAIKTFKTINILCIVGMILFTLLFISLIMRLKNSKKRVLLTNQ